MSFLPFAALCRFAVIFRFSAQGYDRIFLSLVLSASLSANFFFALVFPAGAAFGVAPPPPVPFPPPPPPPPFLGGGALTKGARLLNLGAMEAWTSRSVSSNAGVRLTTTLLNSLAP